MVRAFLGATAHSRLRSRRPHIDTLRAVHIGKFYAKLGDRYGLTVCSCSWYWGPDRRWPGYARWREHARPRPGAE